MGRSNINLVGNTTTGQNIGGGAGVFSGKNTGNNLQFRTIAPTGASIQIFQVGDRILVSGATGGGGGGTITGGTNGLSVSGSDIVLGGNLCCSTVIKNNYWGLTFSGTSGAISTCSSYGTIQSVSNAFGCLASTVIDSCYMRFNTNNNSRCAQIEFQRGCNTIRTCTFGGDLCFESTKNSGFGGSFCSCASDCIRLAGGTGSTYGYLRLDKNNVTVGTNLAQYQTYNNGDAYLKTGNNLIVWASKNVCLHNCNSGPGKVIIDFLSGATYGTDFNYRANYTDRSIVDKYYVDTHSGGGGGGIGWSNLACGNTVAGCGTVASGYTFKCNTIYGVCAGGNMSSSGCNNVAIGFQTLRNNTTGCDNIAIGCCTLLNNTTGCYNIANGSNALFGNTTGCYNIALGYNSMICNTGGTHNIAIGTATLFQNTNGSYNVAQGSYALTCNKTGNCNVANGNEALYCNINGSRNTAIGYRALYNNISGCGNVAIGCSAGFNETGSTKLYIANSPSNPLIYGDFSIPMVRICGCLCVTSLPAKTSETCVVYINSAGKLSTGIGGGGITGATNGLCAYNTTNVCLGGALTNNVTLTGNYCLSLCNDAKLNVACGYQISGVTIYRTSPTTLESIYIGCCAGSSVAPSSQPNIAIGTCALCSIVSVSSGGAYNIGIGSYALKSATCGSNNIGIGYASLYNATGAALSTQGSKNIAIGSYALCSLTTSNDNIAIGNNALCKNTGSCNIGIGPNVMPNNTSGANNIAIGQNALCGNVSGAQNIAIGQDSLCVNASNYSIAIGYQTLKNSSYVSAAQNIAIGCQALMCNVGATTYCGQQNIAIGGQSAYSLTGGSNNIAIGFCSMCGAKCTASCNIGIGYQALKNISCGSYNVVAGYQAGYNITTAPNNIMIGNQAGYSTTTACNNIAIGCLALQYNQTGIRNIAIGENALQWNCANYNIGIGYNALCGSPYLTGTQNVAVGMFSFSKKSSGNFNTALGSQTFYCNQTGECNTGVGFGALTYNVCGDENTAIGSLAMMNHLCGCRNVAIGHQAGLNNLTGSSNIFIGYAAGISETGSSKLHIGTYLYGEDGNRLKSCGTFESVSYLYLGEKDTNGSWRFNRSGSNLILEQMPTTGGTYVAICTFIGT